MLLPFLLIVACGGAASERTGSPTPSGGHPAPMTPTGAASPPPLASPTSQAGGTPAAGPTATTGPATLATSTASVSQASLTITTADDNQTLVVSLGQYLVLALDSGFDWSNIEVSDPSVLQAVAGATPPAGAQGVYKAARDGEATLSATGTVHCQPNVPCPLLARLFRVTIRVGP